MAARKTVCPAAILQPQADVWKYLRIAAGPYPLYGFLYKATAYLIAKGNG